MEIKILKEENSIFKINWFFLVTLLWAIISQFFPLPANFYQYVAFLIPISIYLLLNISNLERILKPNMLNLRSIFIIFSIWLASLPLVFLIVEIYVSIFGSTLADMVSQDSHERFILNFFFVAITPSVLEEILLRGIILDGYRNKPRYIAAIMNGLMFGMLHLNSFQFFHTFVAGFIASYLVFATNSLFAGIFIHTINNGLPLLISHLYPINSNIGYAEDTNFFSLIFFAILGVFLVFKLIKLLFKVNNIPFKDNRNLSKEKIFNLPLILSILSFIGFSVFIILLI